MNGFDDVDADAQLPRRLDWGLWRRLLAHARPYRRHVILLIACGLLLAAVDISLPLVTGALVDRATSGAETQSLWLAYGGLLLLFSVLVWGLIALAGVIASGVGHDLRKAGFARLQELPFAYYDRRPVGWLVSRLTSDCEKISGLLPWFSLDMT
ncbi:MAG TPA: ABC transporter transmembrane domain-containing protein, partial [Nannocystaceae bacterium]|nr:ABC transporter transmembrane domain-containing protein [Nannocystaceae bacterium]